jgi:hypothetical protein
LEEQEKILKEKEIKKKTDITAEGPTESNK